MYAAMFPREANLQIVKLLVKHGAQVNASVKNAFYGNKEILDFLSTI